MSRPSVVRSVKVPSCFILNPCENSPASSSWTINAPARVLSSVLSSFNIWSAFVFNSKSSEIILSPASEPGAPSVLFSNTEPPCWEPPVSNVIYAPIVTIPSKRSVSVVVPSKSTWIISPTPSRTIKSPVYSCISKTSWLNKLISIPPASSSVIILPSCASAISYIIGAEPWDPSFSKAHNPSSKKSISVPVSLESSSKSTWIMSSSVSKESIVSSISLSPTPPLISCSSSSSPVVSNARKKPDTSKENKSLPCSNCKSKSVLPPVVSIFASNCPANIPVENPLIS